MKYLDKVIGFAQQMNCQVTYANKEDGVLILNNEQDGVHHLILGVAPPILIMEKLLFSFQEDNLAMFKDLLKKNRDTLHGGFALSENGNRVIYRYTMQLETLDYNEFEGAINALGLLLSEFADNIIEYSKY